MTQTERKVIRAKLGLLESSTSMGCASTAC